MLSKNEITPEEFSALCEFVCNQLTSTDNEEIDRRTLNFGIYWQTSLILNEKVADINESVQSIQQNLVNLLEGSSIDSREVLNIVNRNIDEVLNKNVYGTQEKK